MSETVILKKNPKHIYICIILILWFRGDQQFVLEQKSHEILDNSQRVHITTIIIHITMTESKFKSPAYH